MFPLGLLCGIMGFESGSGSSAGPIKQSKLRDKKMVISTAHNGGLPFKSGSSKPTGNYETVVMKFSSQEDIEDRHYKSIKLLSTYKTKAAALAGHRRWLLKIKSPFAPL